MQAQHLYFRDVIGNISTSHIRHSAGKVLLMMKPRYPLMGSWVTEFTLGYSLPLEAAVTQAGGDYTLRFDFAPPLDQVRPSRPLRLRSTIRRPYYDR